MMDGGQSEVISMMQSWDNISKPFLGHAHEFLRFKGTSVSWVKDHEDSHSHIFFACSWTSLLWTKVKSWLRLCRDMPTISSAIRGLNLKGKNVVVGMKRVSLHIVVYLIWKERNRRVFENSYTLVESLFQRFQVLFYMILHFHECNHLQINVS
ncbi:hypothetical protein Peur_033742 [Populus x canadensis]